MNKIYDLENWVLNKGVSNNKRFAEVKIRLAYPEQKSLIELKPKERVKKIDREHQDNLKKLIALNLFDNYELIGKKKRPIGVEVRIKFSALAKLKKIDFIDSIWIKNIDDATLLKDKEPEVDKYFCVKMTVVIEVEGILSKKQSIEKRFVVIKAKSFDDAYDKLEKQREIMYSLI